MRKVFRPISFNIDPETENNIKVIRSKFQARDLTQQVTRTEVIKYALRKAAEEIQKNTPKDTSL